MWRFNENVWKYVFIWIYCIIVSHARQKVAMTSIKKTLSDRIKERGQITLTGRGKVRQIIYWICFLSQTIRGMVILTQRYNIWSWFVWDRNSERLFFLFKMMLNWTQSKEIISGWFFSWNVLLRNAYSGSPTHLLLEVTFSSQMGTLSNECLDCHVQNLPVRRRTPQSNNP